MKASDRQTHGIYHVGDLVRGIRPAMLVRLDSKKLQQSSYPRQLPFEVETDHPGTWETTIGNRNREKGFIDQVTEGIMLGWI